MSEEFYHVRLAVRGEASDWVKLDVTRAQLEDQFLAPYRDAGLLTINGRRVSLAQIESIRISVSNRPGSEAMADFHQRAKSAQGAGGGPSAAWQIAAAGRDVTDLMIADRSGSAWRPSNENMTPDRKPSDSDTTAAPENQLGGRAIFVVHGRDLRARSALSALLRAFRLDIVEWGDAARDLGGSPYIGDIVRAGMQLADATVILATPDEVVQLQRHLQDPSDISDSAVRGQPRANVIYEAGIADAIDHKRTVLVEIGNVSLFSDIAGRSVVRLSGTAESRQELARHLRAAGVSVDTDGTDWLSAGDFDRARERPSRGT